jgi:glycine/D-amino acid oxidase-like deaminating enzyme/nitrite reductase/ring-hydroxylating ferredoxin subunit
MNSVWTQGAIPGVAFPPLAGHVDVDVAVVGAGITGVLTAWRLSDAGMKVALLEAGRTACSNTGGSTGNLYSTVSSGLATLRRKWDDETMREVVAARAAAVDEIERMVADLGIDCGFARVPLQLCVAGDAGDELARLDDEFAALLAAGLPVRRSNHVEALPFPVHRAVVLDGQAQFNPLRFVRAVAAALGRRGVAVHEGTAVLEFEGGDDARLRTADGEVRARQLVFATHTPKGFNLVQAEMEVHREHGIAGHLHRGHYPQGIFWVRDHGTSIRSHRADGEEYLVVVGERHKTGHHRAGHDPRQALRDYASRRFDVRMFTHDWGAQQYRSADSLPYVGPSAHGNVLIATGFGADGLTWGALAARLLARRALGHADPLADRLSPRRFTPLKSARQWASENATVVRHLIADRLSSAELDSLDAVAPGEGRIVELAGTKHAVYRSPERDLTVLSPVCPHLRCHVAWNAADASWDCPCHGSRFAPDGRVLEGPALAGLEPRLLPEAVASVPAARKGEGGSDRPSPPRER